MRYSHIVFDIDGTMMDTEKPDLVSFQRTIKEVTGKDIPWEELRFAFGIPGADALKQMKMDLSALEIWNRHMRSFKDEIELFPGIREILEVLKEKGCRLGIVTSKNRKEFEQDFTMFGLNDYFDIVICADATEKHKPFGDPLLKYMEKAGAQAADVLYVGDSKYDSSCAKDAGVDFVLAGWGTTDRSIECKYLLDDPNEINSLLEE